MKKVLISLLVIVVIVFVGFSVFANFENPDVDLPVASGSNSKLTGAVGRAWNTGVSIVQVLALGTVVFAGLRYMFASVDKKADIKRGLGYLAIGAIFVFGASTIARFIVSVGDHVI